MSRRRSKPRGFPELAGERGEDDGIDPRELHRKPWDSPRQASRKARQLCEQVREALHGAFAACGNDVLQSLSVKRVEPAPHSGRLRVVLEWPRDELAAAVVTEHVTKAAGHLRTEVARSIHRRYAPELVFEVI